MLQHHFNWKKLSAIAGVTWWRVYFHISGPLLVVWDGLASHRSRLIRDVVAGTEGASVLERLPSGPPCSAS